MAQARRAPRRAPAISKNQLFEAQFAGRRTRTSEDVFNLVGTEEDRAKRQGGDVFTIEHETAGMVTMWKPLNDGTGRYTPRIIPSTNIKMSLENGWSPVCPACRTTDCTEDPNSCAALTAPVMYRECPECGKRVYDNKVASIDAIAEEDSEDPEAKQQADPARITDDAYAASTPESRTKARLDRHMLAYHPEEAMSRGLMPQTPRDPTDQRINRS